MKRLVRKPLLILLIAMILFNAVSTMFAFLTLSYHARQAMRASIQQVASHSAITTFVVSEHFADNILSGEGEFTFNGIMYDVLNCARDAGKIVLYCIADGKETELVRGYINSNSTSGSDGIVKILSNLLSGAISAGLPVELHTTGYFHDKSLFFVLYFNLTPQFSPMLETPPPWCC